MDFPLQYRDISLFLALSSSTLFYSSFSFQSPPISDMTLLFPIQILGGGIQVALFSIVTTVLE